MQITRIAVIALVAAAVAAPAAPASVPVDRGTASSAQTAGDFGQSSGYAGMAAHHEAIATRNWERIADAPTVALSPAPSKGFDAVPAIAGMSMVLLTLILLGRSAIGRRRTRLGAAA